MDMHPGALQFFWKLKVTGTIHAGAHEGEEMATYQRHKFNPVTWIEAIPELAQELSVKTRAPDRVICGTLWSKSGQEKNFTVANTSGASSLFELGTATIDYPHIKTERVISVVTTTLDELDLGDGKNLLVLDLQGAEYQALQGGVKILEKIDYIVSEVNRVEVYRGIKLISQIDQLLGSHGFKRVATRWTRHGWGEALFIGSRLQPSSPLASVWFELKTKIYWLWLHLIEIPLVYIRSVIAKLG
jgi:FkbM family methyltransferase